MLLLFNIDSQKTTTSKVNSEQKPMGSIVSSLVGGGEAAAAESTTGESSGPSRVTAFHSSQRWQLHFNSSKQLNKLVILSILHSYVCAFLSVCFCRNINFITFPDSSSMIRINRDLESFLNNNRFELYYWNFCDQILGFREFKFMSALLIDRNISDLIGCFLFDFVFVRSDGGGFFCYMVWTVQVHGAGFQ